MRWRWNLDESEKPPWTRESDFLVDRTRDVGIILAEMAIDYGLSGAEFAGPRRTPI